MRALGLYRTDGLGRVRHELVITRGGGLQHLTLKGDMAPLRSLIYAVDGEGDMLIPGGAALDVDRMVQAVDEAEVLTTRLGYGGIRAGIHIVHYHGVVVPLRHLQLSQQHRVIQCGGYLADASAYGFHDYAVEI